MLLSSTINKMYSHNYALNFNYFIECIASGENNTLGSLHYFIKKKPVQRTKEHLSHNNSLNLNMILPTKDNERKLSQ